MAYKVLWSKWAERDRDRIIEYLLYDSHSPQAASRFMDELDRVIGLLESNPMIFAVSRESRLFRLGYRSCHVMNYVLLYRVEDERTLVGRLFHQAQDYARLL